MEIGRRIYYDSETGDSLVDTGERRGSVVTTTIERDIKTYKALSERNRETFGVIELEYGQYEQDFVESNGYRVNPETTELEFSYPDPSEESQEPVYQAPLSEEVKELKERQDSTEDALLSILMTI